MTLFTPVLFPNENPLAEEMALARGWRVVHQASRTLRLNGVTETVEMPASMMNILAGSLRPADHPGWNRVVEWLSRHVTKPLLVMGPNMGLTDLALYANAAHGIPCAAWLTEAPVGLTPSGLALLTSAEGVLFTSPEAETRFRNTWPTPLESLPDSPLLELRTRRDLPARRRAPGVTNVLLVAYYAGPSPTVGVQRVNYWFDQLAPLSRGRLRVDLAMATAWPGAPAGAHRVRDLGPAEAVLPGGRVEPWGHAAIDQVNEAAKAYPVSGGLWHLSLEKYFDARDDEYDVVLISGNPFSYFEFARYAKRRWHAATILDYRDPFALTPRVERKKKQAARAKHDEIGWSFAADEITVVNQACVPLTLNHNPAAEIVVIPNGFDERVYVPPRPEIDVDGPIKLTHAGQWFEITHPAGLIAAVEGAEGVELHQFGPPMPTNGELTVINHGRFQTRELYERLVTMHCGVAFSSAGGIETPTKVFDYIALGLDVLVLYEGTREGSALNGLLGDTAGVYWVNNTQEDVAQFLETYRPGHHTDPERANRFSRRASAELLLERVLALGDHRYHPPAWMTEAE